MKLAISNIGWNQPYESYYSLMNEYGFSGLEVAPTKFSSNPYDHPKKILEVQQELNKFDISIISMQALLFGTEGLELFTSSSSRLALKEYLKKAILYAEVIKCPILVFGNPKNRILQERKKDYPIAIEFFQELGAFAEQHQTTLCIEPNPESYGTNFITTLEEAFSFVTQIDSHGIGMILDSSTMLMNHNSANEWIDFTSKIKHVHLSMPFLQPLIKEYSFYKEWVLEFLKTLHEHSSASFLSLEMVHNKEEEVESSMKLLKELMNQVV